MPRQKQNYHICKTCCITLRAVQSSPATLRVNRRHVQGSLITSCSQHLSHINSSKFEGSSTSGSIPNCMLDQFFYPQHCNTASRHIPPSPPHLFSCFFRAKNTVVPYPTSLTCRDAAFHVRPSASFLAVSAVLLLKPLEAISGLIFATASATLPGSNRKPFSPSRSMMSGMPPARAATTGTPEAMDSSTTLPSVSDSLGVTNRSALAYAADSSAPCSMPANTVPVPANNRSSSALKGGRWWERDTSKGSQEETGMKRCGDERVCPGCREKMAGCNKCRHRPPTEPMGSKRAFKKPDLNSIQAAEQDMACVCLECVALPQHRSLTDFGTISSTYTLVLQLFRRQCL